MRAYLNRIQGRLVVAFGIGFLGTLAIFWLAMSSLAQFTDRLIDQVGDYSERTELALSLETAVVDQINAGQQFVLSRNPVLRAELDTLAGRFRTLHATYSALPGLSDGTRGRKTTIPIGIASASAIRINNRPSMRAFSIRLGHC